MQGSMSNTMKVDQTTVIASPPGFLTPAELRARWKVSAMFLWRMRRDGKLRPYKFGVRGVRYSLAEVARIEQEAAA